MAPTSNRSRRRRSCYYNKQQGLESTEYGHQNLLTMACCSNGDVKGEEDNGVDVLMSSSTSSSSAAGCCSTPKGQRFRIPEMRTCPATPMKKRVTSKLSSSKTKGSPISFFAPPDLELFFLLASQNLSAA